MRESCRCTRIAAVDLGSAEQSSPGSLPPAALTPFSSLPSNTLSVMSLPSFLYVTLLSCFRSHWFYSSPLFTPLSILSSSAMINRYSSQINRAFVETPH